MRVLNAESCFSKPEADDLEEDEKGQRDGIVMSEVVLGEAASVGNVLR